jgi:alginate O-acetyltransferase complex protein AlgI
MVFTSPSFLFFFLPVFLAVYYLLPAKLRNVFILLASLAFIFSSSGGLILILLFVILSSFIFSQLIEQAEGARRLAFLSTGVALNLLPLLYLKYSEFGATALNQALLYTGAFGFFTVNKVALPIGISFYTFHALSYLWDVNKKAVTPSKSLIDFGMYMVNFPQLIAGPIVRYAEIVDRVRVRPILQENVYAGITTFCFGLAKKSALADPMGLLADRIFGLPHDQLTTPVAWLGAFAYSLQIYYDFSGYSDMAIGLGRLMGFEFPQNFNQPYRSQSITEFWQRWHMTLSRWFRDYVYIPLGGNRRGPMRTYVNLIVVFFLCGLWHGAAYQFIVWGLYHGLLLIIERVLAERCRFVPRGSVAQAVAFLLVLIGWVFFRAPNLIDAKNFLFIMSGFHQGNAAFFSLHFYLTGDKIAALIAGTILAIFPFERFNWFFGDTWPALALRGGLSLACVLYSAGLIAENGFNPFIYFKF